MRTFHYEAFDSAGRRVDGKVDALSRESALAVLSSRGLFPTTVSDATRPAQQRWWQVEIGAGGTMSTAHRAVLTRELATLASAQLPIDTVLEITSLQPMLPATVRASVRDLLEGVTEGAALHVALARTQRFPEAYWRLVEAGEASGSLAGVLTALAADLERQHETQQKVRGALAYPAFLVVAAIATVLVIASVLLPAIAPLFEGSGRTPPAGIAWMLAMQRTFGDYGGLIAAGVTAAALAVIIAGRQQAARRAWHDVLLRVPLVSRLIQQGEVARFARALANMLTAGVPILDALAIARRAQANLAFGAALDPVLDLVGRGGGLAEALKASGRFTDLAVRLISVGEQTGQLEVMLGRVADIYEAAVERDVKVATGLIAPALTLVIGVVVGGLMLSVMQALSSFNELTLR